MGLPLIACGAARFSPAPSGIGLVTARQNSKRAERQPRDSRARLSASDNSRIQHTIMQGWSVRRKPTRSSTRSALVSPT